MDLDALLQNHGEDSPSGEDLEYDSVFTEMEIAAQPGEERQVGDEIIFAEDPDYKEVAEKALDVMGRTHDIRAGVFMAEAQVRLKGFAGFADATGYIAGCMTQYWDSCHPQLDEDDDNDPTMRINAVLALADDKRVLRGVRRAPLTKSRVFGGLSLRMIAVANGEMTPPSDMDTVPDQQSVNAAFQDTDEEDLRAIGAAVAQSLANVEAIDKSFVENTPGQGPDLDPLLKELRKANALVSNALGEPDAAEAGEADGSGAEAGAPAAGGGAPVANGAINSPTDVQNAIDRIISYYERVEPSSPVPILLTRAKGLVGADFMTIVKSMAPGGLQHAQMIGGTLED